MAKDLRVRLKSKDLHRLYLEEKRSLEDIGRMYGVSRMAIWKYCQAERLRRRNRSEARLEAAESGLFLVRKYNKFILGLNGNV